MRCAQAKKFINDHIDHLLGGRREKRLNEHLEVVPIVQSQI